MIMNLCEPREFMTLEEGFSIVSGGTLGYVLQWWGL